MKWTPPAEYDPADLVTLAEAARELGMTNANLHRLRAEHDDFPPPLVEGRTARLYSLEQLTTWNRLRLERHAR